MAYFDAVEIVVTRDDNTTFTFTGRPEADDLFGITQVLGIEFPEVEVFTSPKGLGDGVFFTAQRLQPRTVEIHAKLPGRTPADNFKGRRDAIEFFLMSHTYALTVNVTDPGDSLRSRNLNNCRLIAASYPTIDAMDTNPDVVLQFMAPEAYFEATTQSTSTTANLADATYTTVTAGGEFKVRPIIKMTCTATPANVDSISITMPDNDITSRSVTYGYGSDFQVGDVIIIDPENGTSNINGTDYELYPGDASALFLDCFLPPGEAVRFAYTPRSGGAIVTGTKWTVEFKWTERYSGI